MPALHTGWRLSLPERSACPWGPALLISRTQCDVDSCSQSRSAGQVRGAPGLLPSPHSAPLSPACRLGCRDGFSPTQSQLCHLFCVIFLPRYTCSPGGLFCSLQGVFKFSCISIFSPFMCSWKKVSALPSCSLTFFSAPLCSDVFLLLLGDPCHCHHVSEPGLACQRVRRHVEPSGHAILDQLSADTQELSTGV